MEQLNNNFLVVDDRLKHSSKVPFAVYQGAQSVNKQVFQSTSSSSNNINWNIQVPSENVTLDRRVLLKCTLDYTITGPAKDDADAFVEYVASLFEGESVENVYKKVGFSYFPLHHHISSTSVQINNTTVTQNTNEILDTIVRCLSIDDLAYNSESVNLPDYYFDLNDDRAETGPTSKVGRMFGNYDELTFKPNLFPRQTNLNYTFSPIIGSNNSCTLSINVVEPLMISPFVYDSQMHEGLTGLSNLIINLVLNANTKRVFKSCNIVWGTDLNNIVLNNVSKAEACMTFLSPKPSEVPTSARSVVPYYELRTFTRDTNIILSGQTTNFSSDSLQLPVVPDMVLIYLKPKRVGGVDLSSDPNGCRFGETYGTIQNININFNNNNGLLSSATPETLFEMSKRHTNLLYPEFSNSGLCGSFLALAFGTDIQISDQYLSPGSIGQFSIQYNLNMINDTVFDIQYTLNTVFLYRGVFSSERSISSTYLGLLSKEQVMEASKLRPVRMGELQNMVGAGRSGGFLGMLASLLPGLISGVSSLFEKKGSGVSGGASKVQSILDKYSM
jgi:hypothetical protein